jgi:hypothetical protein
MSGRGGRLDGVSSYDREDPVMMPVSRQNLERHVGDAESD